MAADVRTGSWQRQPLQSLVEEGKPICYGVLKPGDLHPEGVPLVRIVDIEGNAVDEDALFRISPTLDREFRRSRLDGGELLVSIQGTVGRVALASAHLRGANISRTIARVAIDVGAEPAFIKHWMLSSEGQKAFDDAVVGTTRSSLNIAALRAIDIPTPPLPEQRRIAEILDTLDKTIRKTEEVIAKLGQVKQGLLNDLLTRGIGENGELRDPARHPQRFKDSPLGLIPGVWTVEKTGECVAAPVCYGIVQAGPFVEGGPQVLTIGDLNGDYRSGLHRTASGIDKQYARSRVQPGDVLLSIKGTIGRVGVVPDWFQGNISRDLARIRLGARMRPSFLRHYLESPAGQRRLELAVVGTTRAEISIRVLKELLLPQPPSSEQDLIANRLDLVTVAIGRERCDLDKLKDLKRGLMYDLLTGRVRVKVPGGSNA